MNVDELKSLAKQLPEHRPDAERSLALRQNLLDSVASETATASQPKYWLPLAAVAGVVLAFYAGTRMPDKVNSDALLSNTEFSSASLASDDGAAFTRQVNPETHTEEIRLSNGGLRIDSATSHQLVVHTRFAELRGDAAVFKVQASDNLLRSVVVQSGQVELHIENQPAVILGPGQEWKNGQIVEHIELALRDAPAETSAPEPLPPIATMESEPETKQLVESELTKSKSSIPAKNKGEARAKQGTESSPKVSRTHPNVGNVLPEVNPENISPKKADLVEPDDTSDNVSAPVPKASPAELAFASGYRALKQRRYPQAIADFNTAIKTGSDHAMRGDSRYWRSIAMAKSGQNTQAIASMSEFIDHHNTSPRAGEIATMLGWLYLERGKLERASALFKRGQQDTSAKVRNSAEAGQKAIAQ